MSKTEARDVHRTSPLRAPLDKTDEIGHSQCFEIVGDCDAADPGANFRLRYCANDVRMLNDSDEVEFQISAAAIDELLGGPGGGPVDREIRFSLLRETIERLASDEFSSSNFARALRIFAKDTRKK
jgi:hypothetical protein